MDTQLQYLPSHRVEMVRAFDRSSLTKKEFCRTHSVARSTLDYWRRQVSRAGLSGALQDSSFIEVVVSENSGDVKNSDEPLAVAPSPQVEVELPFGVKLRFFNVPVEARG